MPKGHYLFVPLAQSNLSCKQVVTLLRRFLAAPQNQLPGRGWWPGRRARSPTAAAARSASGSSRRRRDPAPAPPGRRRAAAPYAGSRLTAGTGTARPPPIATSSSMSESISACAPSSMRPSARTARTPGASLPRCAARRERAAPAAPQPRPAPVRLGERDAACGAGALDPRLGRRADHGRRHRVEVLAALLVDRVVVGAQQPADHGVGARRPVGERLAGEHGGELHDAHPLGRGAVLSAAESDGLVGRCGSHVDLLFARLAASGGSGHSPYPAAARASGGARNFPMPPRWPTSVPAQTWPTTRSSTPRTPR